MPVGDGLTIKIGIGEECPFCGSEDIAWNNEVTCKGYDKWIECQGCHARHIDEEHWKKRLTTTEVTPRNGE